ncbi:MAG: hypothetical protein ABH821_01690 [archaeon]
MSQEKFVEDAAKGATNAVLEYSEGKIKSLVNKFMQGELAFIEDEETIQIVKSQRKKPEWKFYRQYVENPKLRMQIEMGFSLKQLQKDSSKLQNLRKKIVKKYTSKGLHVAELAQSGVISRYIAHLLGHTEDEDELREGIEEVLQDIDKYVIFVKSDDEIKDIEEKILNKINVLSPKAIIMFSCSSRVIDKASKVINKIKKKVSEYIFETQVEESTCQRYDFILKKPVDYFSLLHKNP